MLIALPHTALLQRTLATHPLTPLLSPSPLSSPSLSQASIFGHGDEREQQSAKELQALLFRVDLRLPTLSSAILTPLGIPSLKDVNEEPVLPLSLSHAYLRCDIVHHTSYPCTFLLSSPSFNFHSPSPSLHPLFSSNPLPYSLPFSPPPSFLPDTISPPSTRTSATSHAPRSSTSKPWSRCVPSMAPMSIPTSSRA